MVPRRIQSPLGRSTASPTPRSEKHSPDGERHGTAIRQLNYDLKQMCRRNRDGSRATQRDRERHLTLMANDLHAMGFHHMRPTSLKTKHVEALVALWRDRGLSDGRMRNLMATLRWWAAKVDRRGVVAKSNDHYGIADRSQVARFSRARQLAPEALARVTDRLVRLSLHLQRLFGLRREEAIKFRPSIADHGDRVVLKASWTKGGRGRVIPVRNAEQRKLLDQLHAEVGNGSLIPPGARYVDQMRRYERQTANAGLSRMHGLRHAYAQQRYLEITGRECPIAGGPKSSELSASERWLDRQARLEISRELGHGREQITTVYLGR